MTSSDRSASSSSPASTSDRGLPQTTSRGPMLGRGMACTRCKKRKQRCDGVYPSCSNCTGASKDCEYVNGVKPRRKPLVTAGEALAAKYARLQDRYAVLLATSNESVPPTSPTASARSSFHGSAFSRRSPSLASSKAKATEDAAAWAMSVGPTAFEHFVHDPLINAVLVDDMPPQDRDRLLWIFFSGSNRLGCPILPDRFFPRLNDPDEHKRPHPALVNAMLLVGLAFTSWTPGYSTAKRWDLPPTTPSAAVLLAKTRAHLHEALSKVDRMLDYLQASTLLSYYFFQQDRLGEGQLTSAANSRMAIMCKLHLIDQAVSEEMLPGRSPPPGQSMWDQSLLGRPEDTYELGVRIWTFWQAWYYDSVFSLIMGTDLMRDPTTPTTVFPRPAATYESGLAITLRNTSFKELYENDPPQFPSPDDEPAGSSHPLATYLKGLAIMERTNRLLVKVHRGFPLDETDFTSETLLKLHKSLQDLVLEQLPIHEPEMLATSTLSTTAACKIYCALAERIVGHVFVHTSTIQLCRLARTLSGNEPSRSTELLSIELDAAKASVKALRIFAEEVRKLDNRLRGLKEVMSGVSVITEVQEHPCLLLGFLLTSISMVLVDRIHTLKQTLASSMSDADAAIARADLKSAEDDLTLCIKTIQRTSDSFPLLKTQAQKIEAYRERSRDVPDLHEPEWEFERRAALASGLRAH